VLTVGTALNVLGLMVSISLSPLPWVGHIAYLGMLLAHVPALLIVRSGRLKIGIGLFVGLYLSTILLTMARRGGLHVPAGFVLPPLVLFVGLTWSGRAALVTGCAASLGGFALVLLQRAQLLPAAPEFDPLRIWTAATMALVITACMLMVALRAVEDSRAEARASQRAREELEEHVARARRLESVSRLAAGVAHDFNNLLTVILAEAESIANHAPDTRMVRSSENILTAAEKAAVLTRQLLAFGRREVITPGALDLNGVIRPLHNLLGKMIGESVRFRLELSEGLAPICADQSEIEQVLLNLCSNASDAMPHGGNLTVTTRAASGTQVRCLPNQGDHRDWLCMEVADTGTGMDLETQAKLFEPFFTTKEHGQGTGLGLATVHGIVTRMGGHVVVESILGQGTTFLLLLPTLPVVVLGMPERNHVMAPFPTVDSSLDRSPFLPAVDRSPFPPIESGVQQVLEEPQNDQELCQFPR